MTTLTLFHMVIQLPSCGLIQTVYSQHQQVIVYPLNKHTCAVHHAVEPHLAPSFRPSGVFRGLTDVLASQNSTLSALSGLLTASPDVASALASTSNITI
jgi:hypothetical protein